MRIRHLLTGAGALLLAGFLGIQAVPYGRAHENPAVLAEPAWDSPETRALVKTACFDCHSNETEWPWYSHVAPVSWLVQYDVDEGRKELNFSEWGRGEQEGDEAAEAVIEGEMPMPIYLVTHPQARFDPAQTARLIRGLEATFGTEGGGEHGGRGVRGGDDD